MKQSPFCSIGLLAKKQKKHVMLKDLTARLDSDAQDS
jgi:hypothetical protein